jgi:hypothetical protein
LLSFRGIETTKDKVTLSDISVRAFKVFITYVYTNVYSIPDLSYDESFVLHAEVYILADRMCMTDLRTVAFNRVKENVVKGGLNVQHVSRVVEYVYDNTPDRDLDVPGVKEETGSGNTQEIRMLLAKLCCYNLKALMNHRLLPRVLRRHGELAIDMLHRLKDL